jgi:hypothetical protein
MFRSGPSCLWQVSYLNASLQVYQHIYLPLAAHLEPPRHRRRSSFYLTEVFHVVVPICL